MKRCPNCNSPLKPVKWDIGQGLFVDSLHCYTCRNNVTDERHLQEKLDEFRRRNAKDIKVVGVGEGLGIRFPNEIVEQYRIKKGVKVTVNPGKNGIEIVL